MAVSADKIRVSVTLDNATRSALLDIGKKSDRTVSYIVQQAVKFYLTNHPDIVTSQKKNL